MTISMKTFIMLPLALALIAGCSDDSDTTPTNETSNPTPDGGNQPTVLTTYNGSFLLGCTLSDPDDAAGGSEIVTTTISGDTGTVRAFSYTDSACTTPDNPAEILSDVSIAYPGGTVTTDRGVADFVDVTFESFTVDGQPASPELLTVIEQNGGFDTFYDIILLEDDTSLYFGDSSGDLNGESAETRPNTLDSVPAIRQ